MRPNQVRSRDYKPLKSKILKREPLSSDVIALRLSVPKGFTFHPGQFVMLSVLGYGEVPVGITTSPDEKGYIEVAIRGVGVVTKKLCALEQEEEVGLSGPFGNGFPLSKLKNKDVVLIAGGLGLAPLRSLIQHLNLNPKMVKSLTILNGAKTPSDLLYAKEYHHWEKTAKVFLTVDNCGPEWSGCTGLITKLFDRAEVNVGSIIITCGPPVMFEPVVKRYAGKRVADGDLYFLLERRMKCGVGKCQHCTCGQYYVCLDGPVFSYLNLKHNAEAFK